VFNELINKSIFQKVKGKKATVRSTNTRSSTEAQKSRKDKKKKKKKRSKELKKQRFQAGRVAQVVRVCAKQVLQYDFKPKCCKKKKKKTNKKTQRSPPGSGKIRREMKMGLSMYHKC
jgi:hypothetical protein